MRQYWPLLLSIACAKKGPPPSEEPPVAPVRYACAGPVEVRARYDGDSATVVLPDGRSLVLPHVVSGSGSRYSNDTTTWWIKGDSGFVMTDDSVTIKDCGVVP